MLISAHRGCSGRYPENTLLAFRQALAAGVDGIELDVHVAADAVPVVIHDRDVERTMDGAGYADEMPLVRLQTLDAGAGEHVPNLAEVLDLIGDEVHLDIEIKGHSIERAAAFDDAGLRVVAWTVHDVAEAARLQDLDAYALCTDFPERLAAIQGPA